MNSVGIVMVDLDCIKDMYFFEAQEYHEVFILNSASLWGYVRPFLQVVYLGFIINLEYGEILRHRPDDHAFAPTPISANQINHILQVRDKVSECIEALSH
jgi:hypothetical protein